MEFGPRALGNRSVLADPRRADMKDVLNRRIKHREPFRPFAPAILAERTAEWFEEAQPSPAMLMVLPFRPDKRALVPAVVHVDGSGRLQTVERADNPRFHQLIEAFERQTGVPILLNTSFNENEPIVCTPDEALACFARTSMDLLVLGPWFIRRVR
jgi:carbamoyltransferase